MSSFNGELSKYLVELHREYVLPIVNYNGPNANVKRQEAWLEK